MIDALVPGSSGKRRGAHCVDNCGGVIQPAAVGVGVGVGKKRSLGL